MPDPIDLITANPDESDPATIAAQIDLLVQQFKAAIPQLNAAFIALNFLSTNSTSANSDTIATGSTTITVQAAKSYVAGMTVKVASTASATNWMLGEVTAYDSGTGQLTFYARHINGSGTFADWTVSLAATQQAVGTHLIVAHTGNGHGSSGTKIPRLSTLLTNLGTAMTYADSATAGPSITINEDGTYFFAVSDRNSAGDSHTGLTVNAPDLTASITSSLVVPYLLGPYGQAASGDVSTCSVTAKLTAGDVVRLHTSGNGDSIDSSRFLRAEKIGNA